MVFLFRLFFAFLIAGYSWAIDDNFLSGSDPCRSLDMFFNEEVVSFTGDFPVTALDLRKDEIGSVEKTYTKAVEVSNQCSWKIDGLNGFSKNDKSGGASNFMSTDKETFLRFLDRWRDKAKTLISASSFIAGSSASYLGAKDKGNCLDVAHYSVASRVFEISDAEKLQQLVGLVDICEEKVNSIASIFNTGLVDDQQRLAKVLKNIFGGDAISAVNNFQVLKDLAPKVLTMISIRKAMQTERPISSVLSLSCESIIGRFSDGSSVDLLDDVSVLNAVQGALNQCSLEISYYNQQGLANKYLNAIVEVKNNVNDLYGAIVLKKCQAMRKYQVAILSEKLISLRAELVELEGVLKEENQITKLGGVTNLYRRRLIAERMHDINNKLNEAFLEYRKLGGQYKNLKLVRPEKRPDLCM